LLGIDQMQIYGPGMLNGMPDGVTGDLMENNPLGPGRIQLQLILKMPGNGLPLPVLIRRQPYHPGPPGQLAKL